jgi:hypothetical protein
MQLCINNHRDYFEHLIKIVYNYGEFIIKIYDTDLFLKNLSEKSTHPPKNANRFFFIQSRTPLPQKN